MPIEGLTANSFDVAAILIKPGRHASRREAPLGLLLNRLKRMPVSKLKQTQIQFGAVVFNSVDIVELLESEEYEAWLRTPRVALRWWSEDPRRQGR
jgi:hypothetical protein